mmetsp:Transcript_6248/g.8536  ORF Transcript_6248/g.8536 Transcript_6248/m.8536 type:complete len:127 (+) Transcript_6248:38-418(+)
MLAVRRTCGQTAVRCLSIQGAARSATSVYAHEDPLFEKRVADMQKFMDADRFKHIKRTYSAEDVVHLQGSLPLHYNGAKMSEKLYDMLRDYQAKGTCSHTFGALDTVQVVQMAKYLKTVYVSGRKH